MEKAEPMFPLQAVALPQPSSLRAAHPPLRHPIPAALQLRHAAHGPLRAQLSATVPPMTRFPQESLQGDGPLQTRVLFKPPLKVPQLMSQTPLPSLGRGLKLSPQAIPDPALHVLLLSRVGI